MATLADAQTWNGLKVRDADGARIGTLQDLFLDRHTGEPAWATVKMGMFGATGRAGLSTAFIPVDDAEREDAHHLKVNVHRDEVKHAPRLHTGTQLSRDEERQLWEYYKRTDYDAWTETERGRLEKVF